MKAALFVGAVAAMLVLAVFLSGCPGTATATCGDKNCSAGETIASCAMDCNKSAGIKGSCGDGTCDAVEQKNPSSCPKDCGGFAGETLSVPLSEVNFRKLASGTDFASVLKLHHPTLDPSARKIYLNGTKTSVIVVINPDTMEEIDSIDIGAKTDGYLLIENGKLYSLIVETRSPTCTEIDLENKTLGSEVDAAHCEEVLNRDFMPREGEKWNGYTFRSAGYVGKNKGGYDSYPVGSTQELSVATNIITIYDSSDNVAGKIVSPGPEGIYFTIDPVTQRLFTGNIAGGSVSVFDLGGLEDNSDGNFCYKNSCWIKDIDVGDSIDQIILGANGEVYARGRLGGGALYFYSTNTEEFTSILSENVLSNQVALFRDNNWKGNALGEWPTDMALSADGKKIFMLSHFGARIDVIDAEKKEVTGRIDFYPEFVSVFPRTDGISAMISDSSDNLYAALPELSTIVIASGKNNSVTKVLDLKTYGMTLLPGGGPGKLNLAVDEDRDLLYVLVAENSKYTLMAISLSDYSQKETKSLPLSHKGPYLLMFNPEKDELYAANHVIDAATFEEKPEFSLGDKVIGFDNTAGKTYLYGSAKSNEYVYVYKDGKPLEQFNLGPLLELESAFAFDFVAKEMHVGSFNKSIMRTFDLTKGLAIAETGGGTTGNSTGRCGDGTCDEIESSKGVCPEDCEEEKPLPKPTGGTGNDLCGDGTCDEIESSKGVCPEDCS